MQLVHLALPGADVRGFSHGMHAASPSVGAYSPAAQLVQAAAPPSDDAPRGQVEHAAAPAADAVPAAHGTHPMAPLVAVYVPSVQLLQVSIPFALA